MPKHSSYLMMQPAIGFGLLSLSSLVSCQLPQPRTEAMQSVPAISQGASIPVDRASVFVEPAQVADGGLALVRVVVPARLVSASAPSGAAEVRVVGRLEKIDFDFYAVDPASGARVRGTRGSSFRP